MKQAEDFALHVERHLLIADHDIDDPGGGDKDVDHFFLTRATTFCAASLRS